MEKQTMDSLLKGFKQVHENLALEHVIYEEDKIWMVATSKYSEVLNSEETLRILSKVANHGGYDTFIETQDILAVGKKLYKKFYFRSNKSVLLTFSSLIANEPASITLFDLPYTLKADQASLVNLHKSLKRIEREVGPVIFSAVTDETEDEVIISTYSFGSELLENDLVFTWVLALSEFEENGKTTFVGKHNKVSFDSKMKMFRRDFRFTSSCCINEIISQAKDWELCRKWKKAISSIPGVVLPRLV